MNVLFASPLGALLAKPWVDPVGLFGLRRWYLPLSRLWAAANAADGDVARFRDEIGSPLPAAWPESLLKGMLSLHDKARSGANDARQAWEEGIFSDGVCDATALDRRRRVMATRHLATRALFYPLLFPRRPVAARWRIESPDDVERALGPLIEDRAALYGVPLQTDSISVSRPFLCGGVKEYWLRAPTPAVRLRHRAGSEVMYARVVEPTDIATRATLIIGSGLCLESELLTVARDPGSRLARKGWRIIEPISPYHGLRAMPDSYGGEPFFAEAPTSAFDLISGQALETALLTGWSRARFGGKVAVAGISMTSFVAQQVASHCTLWPGSARPDAVMLISHSGRVEDVTYGGALASMLGLDRALSEAGWTRASVARLSAAVDPSAAPALPPSRILSLLGETDRWVPYDNGRALAQRWKLPPENLFRYRFGHLGMPVQLTRDQAPFERLMRVLDDA